MCYLESITWGNISEVLLHCITLIYKMVNLFKRTRILTCNWHLISYTVMALSWRDAEKSKSCVNVVAYSPWPIQLVFLSLSFLFGLFYFDSLYVYFFSLYFKHFILFIRLIVTLKLSACTMNFARSPEH